MFLDTNGFGPDNNPEKIPDRKPALTAGEQKTLFWIVAINLVLMLVAPIGGATLLDILLKSLR